MGSDEQSNQGTRCTRVSRSHRPRGVGVGSRRWRQVGQLNRKGDHTMNDIKARVIVSVLGSAATVITLASVVGAGKKWGN